MSDDRPTIPRQMVCAICGKKFTGEFLVSGLYYTSNNQAIGLCGRRCEKKYSGEEPCQNS